MWQSEAIIDPTGNDLYVNENDVFISRTSARYISNVTVSYNIAKFATGMPEDTTVQLAIGNLFNREPNLIQETSGHFGTTELLGQTFTLTIQGRY